MRVNIMGTRGIPASHGGFETFVARLAPYLRDKGHDVLVYCQEEDASKPGRRTDMWNGIQRTHFLPKREGSGGTMEFDYETVKDVLKEPGVDLVLGYNTAVFNLLQLVRGRKIAFNMDGIEWKRAKWGIAPKIWFYINEVVAANMCKFAICDHPEIANHVRKRCFKEPVVIPYGADTITSAPEEPVRQLGLEPGNYFTSIARIEPENSILELVQAFGRLETDAKCVILGRLYDDVPYHQAVKAAASDNVIFPGAIYDADTVSALRYHARAYLHGHQVGGTNPSLVEALGAGNAVLAHDNHFNRWTAGDGQFYFSNVDEASAEMQRILDQDDAVSQAQSLARARHAEEFTWEKILTAYEDILLKLADGKH